MGYIIVTNPSATPIVSIITTVITTFEIPAGSFVVAFVVKPVNPDVLSLGYTPGGTELEDGFETVAGQNNSIVVNRLFDADTTVHFSGVTDAINITMYKL